ncbi:hemerythrin domain-containing protein [Saccharopolyspora sp. MS10]|uniref:hemerythrin domain-containing protein n=1 Tax=Saccharopolyspora sp. MS10 TaxID=3385973 RepID=UPI00399FC27E
MTRHDELPGPAAERGLGDFLVEAHDWLRAELLALRERLDTAPPDLGAQLRAHCRAFCAGLVEHHTGEDRGAFPALAAHFPALAPVLAELTEQHREVDRLRAEIEVLVGNTRPDAPIRRTFECGSTA